MLYQKRNHEALKGLDPVCRNVVSDLLKLLEVAGEDVLIYSAYRTAEEQDELFAEVPKVTHVNDSNSYHVHGLAVDIVPVDIFGNPKWNTHIKFETIARYATELGMEWGYQMWGWDRPHFQYTQGLSIEDLKRGKRLKPRKKRDLEDILEQMKLNRQKRKIERIKKWMKLDPLLKGFTAVVKRLAKRLFL